MQSQHLFYLSGQGPGRNSELAQWKNDQDVLCALGDVALSDSPVSDSFDIVAGYYNFDKELLQADQRRLYKRFKKTHVEKSIKTAAEVIDVLHENSLYEITPEF